MTRVRRLDVRYQTLLIGTAWVGLALVLVTMLALPGAARARTRSPLCVSRTVAPRAQLTLVKTQVVDERTTIYSFMSAAVSRVVRARVVVPEQYLTDPQRRFPVVYHLHGTNNNALTWNLADVKKYVLGTTPVILVLPDSGATDFYTDWAGLPVAAALRSPVVNPPAWDTWQNAELVPWIDQHLRTNGQRAIAGSSMGGFGAISFPERHPGLYDAAASLSGAVDIETPAVKLLISTAYGPCIFGDPVLDAANYHAANPSAHVDRLRGVSLFVQSGNGLPGPYDTPPSPIGPALEFFVHETTVHLLAALKAAHIPVTARLYGNGSHPDGVGPSRFYDFDGMRLFLAQAMPLMTTEEPACPSTRTVAYTLPKGATHVRLTVDDTRHTVHRHGRTLTLSLRNTAAGPHTVRITARIGRHAYARTGHLTTCRAAPGS